MKKKIISLSLATAMALGTIGGAFAETGSTSVTKAATKTSPQYIDGYEDGTFKGKNDVSRAEIAKMVAVIQGLEKTGESFDDVPNDHWAAGFIGAAQKAGLIKGDEAGNFNPLAGLTRAELATIISRVIGTPEGTGKDFSDIEGHWAAEAIDKVSAAGIIEGYSDGTFGPDKKVTRAEAVKMLNGGLLGMISIDEKIAEKVENPFSDDLDWAKNHILAASTEYDYILDAEGNMVIAGSVTQSIVDKAIESAKKDDKISIDLEGADSDIAIETEKALTITLSGDMGDKDLSVDTPNSTVIWDGETTGEITIEDVDNNSFIIRKGKAKGLVFNDTNGGRVSNESKNPIPMVLGAGSVARLEGIFGEIKSKGEGANAPKLTLAAGVEAILSGIFGEITGEGTGANAPKLTLGAGVKAILSGNFGKITNNGAAGIDQSKANIGQIVGDALPSLPGTPVVPPAGGGGGGTSSLTLFNTFTITPSSIAGATSSVSGNTVTLNITGTGSQTLSEIVGTNKFTVNSNKAGTIKLGSSSRTIVAGSYSGGTTGAINRPAGSVGSIDASDLIALVNETISSKLANNADIIAGLPGGKDLDVDFSKATLNQIKTYGGLLGNFSGVTATTTGTKTTVTVTGGSFEYVGGTISPITMVINVTVN